MYGGGGGYVSYVPQGGARRLDYPLPEGQGEDPALHMTPIDEYITRNAAVARYAQDANAFDLFTLARNKRQKEQDDEAFPRAHFEQKHREQVERRSHGDEQHREFVELTQRVPTTREEAEEILKRRMDHEFREHQAHMLGLYEDHLKVFRDYMQAGIERLMRQDPGVRHVMAEHPPVLYVPEGAPLPPPLPRSVPVDELPDDAPTLQETEERVLPQGNQTGFMITLTGNVPFPIERFMVHRKIIRYIVYKRESGRVSGQLHWHAYVEFMHPVPATWVRATFFADALKLWIQTARNRYACRKYVLKRDTTIPGTMHEWGQFRMPTMRRSGIAVRRVSS